MSEKFTLYSPSGVKYVTGNKTEAVRLKARGYSESAPKRAPQPEPKKS